MKAFQKGLAEIHGAVLLFGLAGLFGKFLPIPAPLIVLGRVSFACLTLFLILLLSGRSLTLGNKGDILPLALLGVLLSVHWITFFKSIQVSTVAIGLLSYSTFPVFTAILEPLFFKEYFRPSDLFTALIALLGVALILPGFELHSHITQGVIWGVLSGATFALLSIMNRRYVKRYSSLLITFYQTTVATLVLSPYLLVSGVSLHLRDVLLLAFLGIIATAVAHTLFIEGMKNVQARLASIIACLEPVYGILFAVILLREIPGPRTILGGAVILMTAFYATRKSRIPEEETGKIL